MATKTPLTFEEFERLAESEDEVSYELDEGELVEAPRADPISRRRSTTV